MDAASRMPQPLQVSMENIQPNTHISDELLELYVRGGLPTSQAAAASEHLFECDQCYSEYERTTTFVSAFKEAAPLLARETESAQPWWRIAAVPRPVWAAAMAMALLLVVVPRLRQPGAPVVAELTAQRSGSIVKVAADRPLILKLDPTGADAVGRVRTQVVDASRKTVWEGESELKNGRWEADLNTSLSSGQYWIRVYDPRTGSQVREYALLAE
jgi:hypothetical protein